MDKDPTRFFNLSSSAASNPQGMGGKKKKDRWVTRGVKTFKRSWNMKKYCKNKPTDTHTHRGRRNDSFCSKMKSNWIVDGCPDAQSDFRTSVFLRAATGRVTARQWKADWKLTERFIKWTSDEGGGWWAENLTHLHWVECDQNETTSVHCENLNPSCYLTELHKERMKSNSFSHMMVNQVFCDSHRLRVKLWLSMWLVCKKRQKQLRKKRVLPCYLFIFIFLHIPFNAGCKWTYNL